MSVRDYDLVQSFHVSQGSDGDSGPPIKAEHDDITETKDDVGHIINTRRTAGRLKSKIEKDKYNDLAILTRRRIDTEKKVLWVRTEIRSPFILQALTKVCGDSSLLNTKVVPMVIEYPYLILFQYRDELRDYAKHTDRSDEEKLHLKVLTDFMAREFGRLEVEFAQLIPNGQVAFSTVWTVYKLHEEVLLDHTDYVTCGVVFDVQLTDVWIRNRIQPAWSVGTRSWGYNGTHFGPVDTYTTVHQFDGICDITSLPVYPVRYYKRNDRKDLLGRLMKRGRKWEKMLDVTHRNYEGQWNI